MENPIVLECGAVGEVSILLNDGKGIFTFTTSLLVPLSGGEAFPIVADVHADECPPVQRARSVRVTQSMSSDVRIHSGANCGFLDYRSIPTPASSPATHYANVSAAPRQERQACCTMLLKWQNDQ